MFKRSLIGGLVAATALLTMADTASAIRWGEPDNGEHPYVGIMVALDDAGQPMFRCSGTLVDADTFLTAGHCTYGVDRAEVWFYEDMSAAGAYGYPFVGQASGEAIAHPEYDDNAFFLYDVGVVEIDTVRSGQPITLTADPNDTYAPMPSPASITTDLGYFDRVIAEPGRPTLFDTVGYGLQRNSPVADRVEAVRVRLKATVRLRNDDRVFGGRGDGNYVVFSNNANTGGTCNGDSGGPVFIEGTSTVVAVTSFGVNSNCAGSGGAYRIDQPDDQDFLDDFIGG